MTISNVNAEGSNGSVEQTQKQAPTPVTAFGGWGGGGLFGAPINGTLGSEILTKLKDKLVDIYKQAPAHVIDLIAIDNQVETALAFSVLVVVTRLKQNGKAGTKAAYHTLILEGTGVKPKPIIINENNQQMEYLRVTGNAYDDRLKRIVGAKIRQAYPNCETFAVDASVVPGSFDTENEAQCQSLAMNAAWACGTVLQTVEPGFVDFNFAAFPKDQSLTIELGFRGAPVQDPVGSPVRSDFVISMSSRKEGSNKNQSLNDGDRERSLCSVNGFVDLVYSPAAQQSNNPYMQMLPQAATQKYVPNVIITQINQNFGFTPSCVAWALASVMTLNAHANWMQAFQPNRAVTGVDLRDVGAVAIDANPERDPSGFGPRINTKAATFSTADLGTLLAMLVQQNIMVSIDVPECGPQTWALSMFGAAASGSPEEDKIIRAGFDDLTGGLFSTRYPAAKSLFAGRGDLVHLGTWEDSNGVKRDIRDIDLLAVCNLMGDRNPAYIRDWSDTYTRTDFPVVQRLAARAKMISAMTFDTAEFTGYARRVTFAGEALSVLATCLVECGMNPRVVTPMSASDFNNQRAAASFANSGMVQPGVVFGASNFGTVGNNNQFGTFGRWGNL